MARSCPSGVRLRDSSYRIWTIWSRRIWLKREMEDAWSIRDAGIGGKRKESQTSSCLGKKPKASSSRGFQG